MIRAEHVLAVRNELGEAPLWSSTERALFWVDIGDPAIFRYRPATGEVERFAVSVPVTALGLCGSGGLVAATRDGFAFWRAESPALQFISDPEADRPGTRFNDGAVGPGGRFWAGTTSGDATASLYRLNPDLSVRRVQTGLTLSNGIGWSPDGGTMYLTDTLRLRIDAYDFDVATGEVSRRRVFVATPEGEGVPDGLAVDEEGFVWSVRCRAGKIFRYTPGGDLTAEVPLPVTCPTSCAFGGPRLDELYVTSARSLVPDRERAAQPQAGDLFRLRPGVRGLPERSFQA